MFDTRNRNWHEQANEKPDEYTYRDKHLSLWQSAANFAATNISPALLKSNDQSPSGVATALMAPVHAVNRAVAKVKRANQHFLSVTPDFGALSTIGECAKLAAELLWAELKGDDDAVNILQNRLKFAVCDVPGWAECVTQYALYKASLGPNPYRKNVDITKSIIKDQTRIGIIGDWGTGEQIAIDLLQQVKAQQPDLLIHLGDVYYAGTSTEMTHNFLQVCNSILGPNIPIYSLCGNHDMYSGGAPYYQMLDTIGQQSSYFCLRGNFWQIIAVDTGNNDQNPLTVSTNMTKLNDTEIPWALDKVQNAGGRRTILLSHHQLFSPFGSVGSVDGTPYCFNPNLYGVFKGVLTAVDVWLWGHEHTLAVYDQYMGLGKGRCIGASAIPVFTGQQSYTPDGSLHTFNGTLPTWQGAVQLGNDGTDYNHAFAMINLANATGNIDYFELPIGTRTANKLWSETIP
jgi:predicted phosphodiesterase